MENMLIKVRIMTNDSEQWDENVTKEQLKNYYNGSIDTLIEVNKECGQNVIRIDFIEGEE